MCRELPRTPKSKLDKHLSDPPGQVLLKADQQMTQLSVPKAKTMSATFWRNWYVVLSVVMWNGTVAVANIRAISQRIKNRLSIWASNPTECRLARRYVHICTCDNIHNSQEVEATETSLEMNKDNMVYAYNRITSTLIR